MMVLSFLGEIVMLASVLFDLSFRSVLSNPLVLCLVVVNSFVIITVGMINLSQIVCAILCPCDIVTEFSLDFVGVL